MRTYNFRPDYRHESFAFDDFISGSNGSGTIGLFEWIASGGSPVVLAAVAGHPGIFRLDTGVTASTVAGMGATTNGTGSIWCDDFFDVRFLVRLNTNDADTQVRIGLQGAFSSDPGSSGVYFEKLYADTSWFAVTRYAATQTRSAAVAACSTNWLTARIRRLSSTAIGFTLDAGTEVSQSTNVFTGLAVQPFLQIKNQSAASKTIDIDYFEQRISGLSRT